MLKFSPPGCALRKECVLGHQLGSSNVKLGGTSKRSMACGYCDTDGETPTWKICRGLPRRATSRLYPVRDQRKGSCWLLPPFTYPDCPWVCRFWGFRSEINDEPRDSQRKCQLLQVLDSQPDCHLPHDLGDNGECNSGHCSNDSRAQTVNQSHSIINRSPRSAGRCGRGRGRTRWPSCRGRTASSGRDNTARNWPRRSGSRSTGCRRRRC